MRCTKTYGRLYRWRVIAITWFVTAMVFWALGAYFASGSLLSVCVVVGTQVVAMAVTGCWVSRRMPLARRVIATRRGVTELTVPRSGSSSPRRSGRPARAIEVRRIAWSQVHYCYVDDLGGDCALYFETRGATERWHVAGLDLPHELIAALEKHVRVVRCSSTADEDKKVAEEWILVWQDNACDFSEMKIRREFVAAK